jgi:hypothetical protein
MSTPNQLASQIRKVGNPPIFAYEQIPDAGRRLEHASTSSLIPDAINPVTPWRKTSGTEPQGRTITSRRSTPAKANGLIVTPADRRQRSRSVREMLDNESSIVQTVPDTDTD